MNFKKPHTPNQDSGIRLPWPKGLWLFLFFPFLWSCRPIDATPPVEAPEMVVLDIPPGIPPMEIEPGNELTQIRVDLGRRLFYDPILSRDQTISCSSCHAQVQGFADFTSVSSGVENRQGKRNASTLVNLGWHEAFNHDGGTATLELQMQVPITEHVEMDMTFAEIIERLIKQPDYVRHFAQAYPERGLSGYALTRALGAFERTLVSFNSPYDEYTYRGKGEALNPSQVRGLELFESDRTQCSNCHGGFNFRSPGFANNGLYIQYADSGRAAITIDPGDRGKFKIPTLRNIGVTAPYMHDGSMWSLAEVVDHYATGGANHPNQSQLISGFLLTEQERIDLINFLLALTDQKFLSDPTLAP